MTRTRPVLPDVACRDVRYGEIASPFGRCFVAAGPQGVCRLAFLDDGESPVPHEASLRADWPGAAPAADEAWLAALAARIFPADGNWPAPPLLLRGSEFRIRVWRALQSIPAGTLCSYSDVAAAIGAPRAVRAVASAIAANEIGWLVPCHRVIRADGGYGHYRWGDQRKRGMIEWEAARRAGQGIGQGGGQRVT